MVYIGQLTAFLIEVWEKFVPSNRIEGPIHIASILRREVLC